MKERIPLYRCVTSFCDFRWQRRLLNDPLILDHVTGDERIKLSFGLHPKEAIEYVTKADRNEPSWNLDVTKVAHFPALLRRKEVVAFGEVGLDFSVPEWEWKAQISVLDQLLQTLGGLILELRLPVVLHYRQNLIPKRDVITELQSILERTLGLDHPIQVHHFTGESGEVDRWVSRFSQVHFSLPIGKVQKLSPNQRTEIRSIPKDRLLLETDAPYAQLPGHNYSSPYTVCEVSSALARVWELCVPELIALTTENAIRFFRF